MKTIYVKVILLDYSKNVATIIIGCIFSMLLSDSWAHGLRSIPTPPLMALRESFPCEY